MLFQFPSKLPENKDNYRLILVAYDEKNENAIKALLALKVDPIKKIYKDSVVTRIIERNPNLPYSEIDGMLIKHIIIANI